MIDAPSNEAAKPNPALEPFEMLVGTWKTVGTHPLLPGTTFHGRATLGWLEGGAFLVMHSAYDEPQIPSSITVFGTDDAAGECFALYFDERGVSRKYDVALHGGVWTWRRDFPGFSQRFTGTVSDDGSTIAATWELCRDGSTWEKDLEVTYTRIKSDAEDG